MNGHSAIRVVDSSPHPLDHHRPLRRRRVADAIGGAERGDGPFGMGLAAGVDDAERRVVAADARRRSPRGA